MPEWLTYAQAGERFGLTADAVRMRAHRLGWRVQPGNDGRTLVLVPDDAAVHPRPRSPARSAARSVEGSPEQAAEIAKLIKRADKIAAYYEATALAGFSVEEGRRYFGQPRGLKPGLVAKLTRLTPLPAADSEAKFLKRFNELAQ